MIVSNYTKNANSLEKVGDKMPTAPRPLPRIRVVVQHPGHHVADVLLLVPVGAEVVEVVEDVPRWLQGRGEGRGVGGGGGRGGAGRGGVGEVGAFDVVVVGHVEAGSCQSNLWGAMLMFKICSN